MRAVPALALLAALSLAACETPREACINQGARELRTIEALIRETEGNLRRGYAIDEEQVVRVVPDICETVRPDGSVARTRCERTEVRDVERPRAIDLAAERRALDGLRERRDRLLSEQAARIRACTAAYPE